MKRYLPFVIIVVVLIGALAITWAFWPKNSSNTNSEPFVAASGSPAPAAIASATPKSEPSLAAPADTKVTGDAIVLEEYGDYQCPPCGDLYPQLKQLEHEYGPKQLKIVFHHLPLTGLHKNALAAARAAEAAHLQNKFWEMHDHLYQNQSAWKDAANPQTIFESYAKEIGLNLEQFHSDSQSNRVDQVIRTDVQRAESLGINSTPTVFLDGRQLKYDVTNLNGLRSAIKVLLAQKKSSKQG